jgi:hypothetical protein
VEFRGLSPDSHRTLTGLSQDPWASVTYSLDLHVIHIPGEDNVIVDSLLHFRNSQALAACPGLSISPFQPPQLAMG